MTHTTAARRGGLLLALALALALAAGGCIRTGDGGGRTAPGDPNSRASDAAREFPLDSLPTATVTIGQHTLRVWLAEEGDPERPGVVQEGMMHVASAEIGDDHGMLFVFPDERLRGFWMKNTIAPLDIAFARMNGTIVMIWQMPPLTLRTFSSIEPAMFALEVKQGTFARLGVQEGDRIEIPPELLDLRW
jgi:uncharacterized membrane protein (UPF0127 family)